MKQWLWLSLVAVVALWWLGWRWVFSSDPLNVGTLAPEFALKDQNGTEHRLSDYRGKYVVLMFYPKAFTPGCTAQNCSIRDSFEQLARHAVVLAISTDSAETLNKFAQQHHLRHTLLADVDGTVAKMYGVYNPIGFANRVSLILDPSGKIVKVFPKASTANHAQELLGFFQQNGTPTVESEKKKEAGGVRIGERVPDFTLPDVLSGKPVRLYNLKNKKAIVILFIATRCPVSNAYNERMVNLAKEFQEKGIQFLGINSNRIEPTEEVIEHAKRNGFPFPVLKDEGNKVADLYQAQVTPEAFVLDHRFVLRYHGRIDNSQEVEQVTKQELRAALEAIVAGREVAVKEAKAFGCTIKRVPR